MCSGCNAARAKDETLTRWTYYGTPGYMTNYEALGKYVEGKEKIEAAGAELQKQLQELAAEMGQNALEANRLQNYFLPALNLGPIREKLDAVEHTYNQLRKLCHDATFQASLCGRTGFKGLDGAAG